MKKIRFVFIGCGNIARKHVTALRRLPDAEIAGVYDIKPDVSRAFGEKYGIPSFTSIEEMVEKQDPYVIDILTPTGCHADNIFENIHHKRHFVIEKPLALRLDQVDSILEECDKQAIKIFVVKQNRFNPPIQKLKESITKGRFGKLVLGTIRLRWCRTQEYYDQDSWRGKWAYDGGVLANQTNHHIDMLLWMMGEAVSVSAKMATRLVDIEAEDTCVAIVQFQNGALGVIEATTASRPKDLEGSISILGEKGAVEVGGFFMNELKTWNFTEPDEMDENVWENYSTVPNDLAWNHTEFFKDVVDSIRNDRKGLIDGLEVRKSIELINAIYESVETNKEVTLRYTFKKGRIGVIEGD